MKSKRIVLDTNLWISYLISKKYSELDKLIESKKVVLIFSIELMEEFIEVVNRPKFKKYFSKKDIELLLELFDQYAELIEVTSDLKICRDEKDNFLLNLSTDGKVDYLVTGDNDLLTLEKIDKTKIITFTELIKKLT